MAKDTGDKVKTERDMYQSNLKDAEIEIAQLVHQNERLDRELRNSIELVNKLNQEYAKAVSPDQKPAIKSLVQADCEF